MKPWGTTTVEQRFWKKVNKTDGCWLWTASTVQPRRGWVYGKFWDGQRVVLAHTYSYRLHYGPVPQGLEVDHVRANGCTDTLCVRPDHLEAVTHAENMRRSEKARQTHCIRGHEFDDANTYIKSNGTRSCRACRRVSGGRASVRTP